MKISLRVGKVQPQVGAVDFDLCQPQEREAPQRDRAEIRIVPRLDDLSPPHVGMECSPELVGNFAPAGDMPNESTTSWGDSPARGTRVTRRCTSRPPG